MAAIDGSDDEKVPLPDYERLTQSMRFPEDMEPQPEKTLAHSQSQSHVPKPIAWKLIDKVFKKDGERDKKEKEEGDGDGAGDSPTPSREKKKRSSWMPDPDKRWPIQGWS